MKVVKTVAEVREIVNPIKLQGKKIGLVPTMGFFYMMGI